MKSEEIIEMYVLCYCHIEQAHEQNNVLCGAALHRWMVSGPEMARLIGDLRVQPRSDRTKIAVIISEGSLEM